MGRPPCCDKVGIKKGPWTPEEDIILVSYIQEHGPGNWRSVPINTGLMRCSKSCRLRWTNYLRPGIRRGNFTQHEEGIIVHLQSMLGNRWAAIASYLPQRTDNDIKNYWNTHLKKKLKKHQAIGAIFAPPPPASESSSIVPTTTADATGHVIEHHHHVDMIPHHNPLSKNNYAHINPGEEVTQLIARRSPFAATIDGDSSSSPYASSMDNISKLLNGFMKSSSPQNGATDIKPSATEINPLLSFNHMSSSTSPPPVFSNILPLPPPQQPALMGHRGYYGDELKQQHQQGALSPIEKWLFEEATEQVVNLMDLSDDGCCSVPMMF
ncbi:hypothetical protein HU200_064574 [Digitaria exilis]|uniref:Uncharacterized protein n=1 Tax=Digitaria exilis TaxID=1010633 RepID=A0A835DUH2_9POAL|nr:hypothetical protein HU200_064574 [Digitaria exilis]CAB3490783.1 unnamed protein product [Digitaria exilis]